MKADAVRGREHLERGSPVFTNSDAKKAGDVEWVRTRSEWRRFGSCAPQGFQAGARDQHFPHWKVSPIFATLAKHTAYIRITARGATHVVAATRGRDC
jgi:hypothetical protein